MSLVLATLKCRVVH